MKSACVLVLFTAVSLAVGVSPVAADAGDISPAAQQCQQGGWENWVRADQTPFTNTGDCVSYAAQGGTLTAPKSASQLLCESFGGVFAVGSGSILWSCTYVVTVERARALADQCILGDGGSGLRFFSGDPNGLRTDLCVLE